MNKEELLINGAENISMFCRLNVNIKKDLPIRSSEMGLLIYIVKSEIQTTSVLASDFFKVSKPMITNMVNTLLENGYIIKKQSMADKRSYILEATKKGQLLVSSTYEEYFKVMRLLMKELGLENYKSLIHLLNKSNRILLKGDN